MLVWIIIFAAICGYLLIAALVAGIVDGIVAVDRSFEPPLVSVFWPVALPAWLFARYVMVPVYRWGLRVVLR